MSQNMQKAADRPEDESRVKQISEAGLERVAAGGERNDLAHKTSESGTAAYPQVPLGWRKVSLE